MSGSDVPPGSYSSPTPPASPPSPAPSVSTSSMARMFSSMNLGEQIAVAGAALILVVGEWILGALIGGHGLLVSTPIAAAQLLLFAYVRHSGRAMSWPIPYAVIVAGLATVIVVPAVSELLVTLRNLGTLGQLGGADLLGLLVELVGAALVGWGAFQNWLSEKA